MVSIRTCAWITRSSGRFIIYGIDAAGQALEDAGLTDMTEQQKFRAGCSIGSGIGGLPGIEKESIVLYERGPGRVSPHFVHGRLINLISGQVSIKYGLMGPNHAVVTACSTGAHSIGDAARMIALDDADVMLAGGAEATICPIGIAGFAQAKALSTKRNDDPTAASRPYDKDRDGFVMGEGAGVVVLEEYEQKSIAKWSDMECPAMPITSPLRIRTERVPIGRWKWLSSVPA
jgi:3-oxoacyl-[acyl-carrier-protein] synthase II